MKDLTKNVFVALVGGFADETDELEINVAPLDRAQVLEKAKDKMLLGVAHFAFIKKTDGKLREAYGTLKPSLMPKMDAAQEADAQKKAANPNLQTYFDLEAQAFRSFAIDNIVALF